MKINERIGGPIFICVLVSHLISHATKCLNQRLIVDLWTQQFIQLSVCDNSMWYS